MLPTVIPPLILTKFEHELWYGGGSGGSGGFLSILTGRPVNDKKADSLVSGIKLY